MKDDTEQDRAAEFAMAATAALLPIDSNVHIDIYHVPDTPGALYGIQEGRASRHMEVDSFREASGSTAYGSTMLAIASSSTATLPDLPSPDTPVPAMHVSLRPNPTFLYENARFTEVWIGISNHTSVTIEDGVVFGEIIRLLSAAVKRISAPILLMEMPSSRPFDPRIPEGSERRVRRTADLGIRCAIAIPLQDLARRHSYWRDVVRICSFFGVEAWLGDRRLAKGRGLWYQLVESDDVVYHHHFDQIDAEECRNDATIPLTIVGPARTGSTLAAIHDLTLEDGAVILGVSMSVLAEQAIIHLRLACTELYIDQRKWYSDSKSASTPYREIRKKLPAISHRAYFKSQLGVSAEHGIISSHGATVLGSDSETRLQDYSGCIGPPANASFSLTNNRVALWGGWDVADSRGTFGILQETLRHAARDTFSSADELNIEYLSSRRTINGRLRGRLKMSVSKEQMLSDDAAGNVEDQLSQRCYQLEQRWLASARLEIGVHVEVQVAWQEARVGRWTSLL